MPAITDEEKIRRLQEKIAADEKRVAQLLAKKKDQDRKLETRRKVILGGALMAWLETHPDQRQFVRTILADAGLRDQDQKVIASLLADSA